MMGVLADLVKLQDQDDHFCNDKFWLGHKSKV